MKLNYRLVAVLVCVVIIISSCVTNLNRNGIRNSASSIVVQLVAPSHDSGKFLFRGSGVIIKKEDSTYEIITSYHILDNSNCHEIRYYVGVLLIVECVLPSFPRVFFTQRC